MVLELGQVTVSGRRVGRPKTWRNRPSTRPPLEQARKWAPSLEVTLGPIHAIDDEVTIRILLPEGMSRLSAATRSTVGVSKNDFQRFGAGGESV